MPQISIMMPAYNCEKYVGLAIDSLLTQSFTDFELIILNDGSIDDTEQQILKFKDARIKYFKNDGNKGLIYTRNRLIGLASADILAFLDSDDIAAPQRLETEYSVLQNDQSLAFVSSSFLGIDKFGNRIKGAEWSFDIDPDELKVFFLFNNPVATSSVMLRKSALPEVVFREGYPVCEDYDLWTRIMRKWGGRVLSQFLTEYRLYDESICKQQPDNIIAIRNRIVLNQLEMYFAGLYNKQEAQVHLSLTDFNLLNTSGDVGHVSGWIQKLLQLNQRHHHFDARILAQALYERVLKKFLRLADYDRSVIQTLFRLKRTLKPQLTWELRKKELAILAFSLAGKKFIATD